MRQFFAKARKVLSGKVGELYVDNAIMIIIAVVKVWCMKARPEYLALQLSVDVHAPAVLRANMQPRNFEEWYTTFGVKKSDKMYIALSKRVVIW